MTAEMVDRILIARLDLDPQGMSYVLQVTLLGTSLILCAATTWIT